MAAGKPPAEYHRERALARTSEPEGGRRDPDGEPRFVVRIHDAGTTHFDFRLEGDGVLRGWAVPKGPSGEPHDTCLAVPAEDHPLEYAEFEGVIGRGEYGGGTVIVRDTGT